MDLLGLGDLSTTPVQIDSIAAVFDLRGFTSFCNKAGSGRQVANFIARFLSWFQSEMCEQLIDEVTERGIALYARLPMFMKSMGDGVLVLWDAGQMGTIDMRNVLACMDEIRLAYASKFLPRLGLEIEGVPTVLRCGVARGICYTLGNGSDFIGDCINKAARLQSLQGITFAFDAQGFILNEPGAARFFSSELSMTLREVRGFSSRVQVGVLTKEYDELSQDDRQRFGPVLA